MKKQSGKKSWARWGRNAGFTLVELIVVIAILAILAGVGAVAYNGYIEYAHKGVDRKLVGEIESALELANYDNPALFENNVATVWITKDGAVCSSDGVKQALIKTFGADLSTVKLTSGSWDLAPASIPGLTESGTRVSDYLEAAKAGSQATFADDVFGLWDSVVDAKNNFGGSRDDYLQLAIQYAKGYSSDAGKSPAIGKWLNAKDESDYHITDLGAEDGQAVALARNYCFATYAAKQSLTPEMKAQLQRYIDSGYGMYGMADLGNKFFWDILFGEGGVENNTKQVWESIISSYNSTQSEIDAKAYLALMEAASKVGSEDMKDDEYMNTMKKYLGTVNAYFADPTTLDVVQNISGDCATVTAIKQSDGTLDFKIVPDDLNPRNGEDDNQGSGETNEEPTEVTNSFTVNWNSGTITFSTGENVLAVQAGGNYAISFPKDTLFNSEHYVTGVSVNGVSMEQNGTLQITNGSVKLQKTMSTARLTFYGGADSAGQSATVTLVVTLDDNTSKTFNLTFWVIE